MKTRRQIDFQGKNRELKSREVRVMFRSATKMVMFVLFQMCLCVFPQQSSSDYPSLARGVSGDNPYVDHDIDTVNPFNGNLSINIPLGQRFDLGGDLSHGLVLSYNASAWDFDQVRCYAPNQPGPGFDWFDFDAHVPYRLANAGMGWTLSLGRLFEPNQEPYNRRNNRWVYHGPDEARRGFYPELHPGQGGLDNPPGTNPATVLYTRDGSIIRMRSALAGAHNPPPGAPQNYQILEFTNGTLHEFHNLGSGEEPEWRPTHIRDAHGNYLDVNYLGNRWVLTDHFGRSQTVTFNNDSYQRVDQVALTRFGGGDPAVYRFHYGSYEIERHQYITALADMGCTTGSIPLPSVITVEMLVRIDQPDDTFYAFDYYTDDSETNAQNGRISKSGAIRDMRLPSGLHYAWTYGTSGYTFYYGAFGRAKRVFNEVFGVKSKRRYAKEQQGSQTVEVGLGQWQYEAGFPSSLEAPLDQLDTTDPYAPCYHWRKITDPEGAYQILYFQTAKAGFPYQQILPITFCDPETETFLGDPVSGQPGPGPFPSSEFFDPQGRKIRASYLKFQVIPGAGPPHEKNSFPILDRTLSIAEDGTAHLVENTYSEYDGFGHHRYQTQTTDYPNSDGPRTQYTNYNDGRGSIGVNGSGQIVIPGWNDPWVLETFSESRTEQGGSATVSRYCFNDQTGFLNGERRMVGSSPSASDIIVQYGDDGFGNVSSEAYFGGDGQNPSGDGYCGVAAGTDPVYEIAHQYNVGILERSAYLDCAGAEILVHLDQSIDTHTGLVAASRDPSGIATQFGYDLMGREVFRQTGSGARYEKQYLLPTDDHSHRKPTIVERTCLDSQPGCSDDQSRTLQSVTYDWLGRVRRESQRLPNADGSGTRITEHFMEYNLLGWPTKTRVWRREGNGANAAAIQYFDYDGLGRPGRVVNPDGSETTFTYQGEWSSEKQVQVQGQGTSLTAKSLRVNDGFGRLIRVEEQSGSGSGFIKTTYAYDENHRLVSVCVNDDDNDGNTCPDSGQLRTFNYDGRGFLSLESHPEWGDGQTVSATYTYDPRGKRLSQNFPGTYFDLTYRYDRAERPTQTEGTSGLLKEYFYGRQNNGSNRSSGKLITAKRHNRVKTPASGTTPEDVVVTESFTYAGPRGLLSEIELRTSKGDLFQTEITAYDALGNITGLQYPQCMGPDCTSVGPSRELSFDFESGLLVGIPGYVSDMGYHPDGRLRRLAHSNGVVETLELDNRIWRLKEVYTTGIAGGQDWSYGPYAYDADGNVTAIGADSYSYDRVSRLVHATVQTPGGPQNHTAEYDPFGNLTSLFNGESGPGALSVDGLRNRLSDDTATHDQLGNVTELNLGSAVYSYRYDPLSMMTELEAVGGLSKSYLYNADGRRIAALSLDTHQTDWTIRGPEGELLRRFSSQDRQWQWEKDYVNGANRPIATVTDTSVRALHLDHLGTPRRITDENAELKESHAYFPFGFYTVDPAETGEPLRFGGHERDANGDVVGDLDYMVARYYQPHLGRFLSVDPVLGRASQPQTWNRYAYGVNNPVKFVDPDGRVALVADKIGFGVAVLAVATILVVENALNDQDARTAIRNAVNDVGLAISEFARRRDKDKTRDNPYEGDKTDDPRDADDDIPPEEELTKPRGTPSNEKKERRQFRRENPEEQFRNTDEFLKDSKNRDVMQSNKKSEQRANNNMEEKARRQ